MYIYVWIVCRIINIFPWISFRTDSFWYQGPSWCLPFSETRVTQPAVYLKCYYHDYNALSMFNMHVRSIHWIINVLYVCLKYPLNYQCFSLWPASVGSNVGHVPRSPDAASVRAPGGGDRDAPGRGLLQELSQNSTHRPLDNGGNCHYWYGAIFKRAIYKIVTFMHLLWKHFVEIKPHQWHTYILFRL